ncbi:hypothetical protein SLNWT_0823 [Streptomyces albus]|uniref:Uncharacterized protein n=1 Tax=Streptomyces albus (strain ATCC 21838 / DSM 41398 / FERM P-419 / JCM 4703 / NBRC 107858) TaxID=1081613 RepID=A0A0B5EIC1_STRA4|nr:hypothetical protein SLNWT_0823 [Streptomyces albus]AOU75513.1 hypothetical protein SLNHY_0822 [Streptomyces albus]AYN31316.1 hypothetical protein DUI70_0813 [Streptomyces albus]
MKTKLRSSGIGRQVLEAIQYLDSCSPFTWTSVARDMPEHLDPPP